MKQVVVAFTLSGNGDVIKFFVPREAYDWMLTVKPGGYQVPDDLVEILRPFADNEEDFNNIIQGENDATTGSYENDIALFFASFCYQYESERAMTQDAVMHDWEVSEIHYEGVIY